MISIEYKTITISDGSIAKVDTEDYERIASYHWHKDGAGYARTNLWNKNMKPRMHRLVLEGVSTKLHIDHINGDRLDNRKSNLRICTCSQNVMNRGPQANNSSGFKGVIFDKSRNKWRAEICVDKKRIYLGRYETAEKAAEAYNFAAIKYHGEYAFINDL